MWNRNHLALTRSPCGVNLIGCPRIELDSLVAFTAASTLLRLGVPDLHADAIASSSTWVAAYVGGPNVPNFGNTDVACWTSEASAGMPRMSGPNVETYEPGIVKVPGESVPSVPTIVTFLCCSARFLPNCSAFGAICHGSTATVMSGVNFATSEEKSVTFWLTDSWSTLIPAALKIGIIEDTSPVE